MGLTPTYGDFLIQTAPIRALTHQQHYETNTYNTAHGTRQRCSENAHLKVGLVATVSASVLISRFIAQLGFIPHCRSNCLYWPSWPATVVTVYVGCKSGFNRILSLIPNPSHKSITLGSSVTFNRPHISAPKYLLRFT